MFFAAPQTAQILTTDKVTTDAIDRSAILLLGFVRYSKRINTSCKQIEKIERGGKQKKKNRSKSSENPVYYKVKFCFIRETC